MLLPKEAAAPATVANYPTKGLAPGAKPFGYILSTPLVRYTS